MAKDSFFIRGFTTGAGGAYVETAIDIGHVVDALGKTVMRIHNVATQVYEFSPQQEFSIPANSGAVVAWQLTTQPQTTILAANDRSVIATGRLDMANASSTANILTYLSDRADVMPQAWTNGYLVGVEQLYLGVFTDAQLSDSNVALVLECTSETLSASAAMSLALSQQ